MFIRMIKCDFVSDGKLHLGQDRLALEHLGASGGATRVAVGSGHGGSAPPLRLGQVRVLRGGPAGSRLRGLPGLDL